MDYRNWTPEEEQTLRELVDTNKYSYRQIGTMMGRSINSVTCHARQYLDIRNNEYEQRKYYHDIDFFKTPNIISSYVAGFWAADGNVMETKTGYRLRIELAVLDEKHLQWLKDIMKHDGPLKSWGDSGTKFFQIHVSKEYGKQLADNFGVIPNKTHRLQPPSLDGFDLRFAFLLGLLDGDGCICVSKKEHKNLSMSYTSSSIAALEWVHYMVNGMNFPVVTRKKDPQIKSRKDANAYFIYYTGARAVCLVQLAQYFVRKHNIPILARKWNHDRLNEYISEFYARFPKFSFDPEKSYESYLNDPHFRVSSNTNSI